MDANEGILRHLEDLPVWIEFVEREAHKRGSASLSLAYYHRCCDLYVTRLRSGYEYICTALTTDERDGPMPTTRNRQVLYRAMTLFFIGQRKGEWDLERGFFCARED